MSLQILDPTTYPGWDDLLLTSKDYSFFHCSSWAKVLSESYGYTPFYFTLIEGEKLRALVPVMEVNSFLTGKRAVSLPFTDFCEPIINGEIPFSDILIEIINFGKKRGWKYLELRGGSRFLSAENLSLSPRDSRFTIPSINYISHILDLRIGEEELFKRFRDSTRRNIKKAIREGIKHEISQSLHSLKEFYRLNCLTRKDHGLPPQPYSFFEKLYEHIVAKNFGFIALDFFEEKAVAGAVFLCFKDDAVYKYGASDKTFQHLRANNLAMWEGMRECMRRGCMNLSLGRTDLDHTGLLQFKRGWGAKEQQINYYRYDLKKGSFVLSFLNDSGLSKKFLKIMPAFVLNQMGSLFYKHFG